MRFVLHLKPIVEREDKADIDEVLSAIKSAFNKAGLDINDIDKSEIVVSDEQKKTIYKNIKLPDLKSPNRNGHLWKSNFVLLVSSFEYLISDLISFYFKFYPEQELDSIFEMNLKNIQEYKNIEDFVNDIIAKKVEKLLYKSNDAQLKYIEENLKLNLERKIIDWEKIKEAILRRHLIIHNNAIINSRYINEVKKEYAIDVPELKEGKPVFISSDYFNQVYQELFVAGNILIQNSLRKWLKEFDEVANAELIDLTYNGNIEKSYSISEKIGKYGKKLNTINNDFKFIININYCLSLKNQNKKKELEIELEEIDISNLSPIYKLAYFSLQDNCSEAIKHIRHAKTVDKLKFDDVLQWPLFEGLRKDTKFIDSIYKIYRRKKPTKIKKATNPPLHPTANTLG